MKRVETRFFRTASGNEPVKTWLSKLNSEERKKVGIAIKKIEFRWPVGMPVCRPMGDGLWEVRTQSPDGTPLRVLFAIVRNQMILLHGFAKKSEKTPDNELRIARERLKEFNRYEKDKD